MSADVLHKMQCTSARFVLHAFGRVFTPVHARSHFAEPTDASASGTILPSCLAQGGVHTESTPFDRVK